MKTTISTPAFAFAALAIAMVSIWPAEACAKKKVPVVQEQPAAPVVEEETENPVITEECIMNVSLFTESAKNKQYADAVEPWYEVYKTCPNAHQAIYVYGPKIIGWQIEQATDEAQKAQLKALLLTTFDKRIKYFGNSAKYPTPYILGQKGMAYCDYFPEDSLHAGAYEWLKTAVYEFGDKNPLDVVGKFAEVSNLLYKSDPEKYDAQYIADYQKVSDVLNAIASNPADKKALAARQTKDYIDNIFAISGAADCAKLDELYAALVNNSLQDIEMLNKIMRLYRRVDCGESNVYFTAAQAAHLLQPTEESAAGCAKMCLQKEDYKGAVEYYEQAVEMAAENEDKATYEYLMSFIYFSNLKNYPIARQHARKSLEYQPNQGRCYLLIGYMYAASKPYDDPVMDKTVFYAACDKFNQAKNVDPSCTEEAQKAINMYSKYFPTNEEIFFNAANGLVKGKAFTVGGWIGESTICR